MFRTYPTLAHIDYERIPYVGYAQSDALYFPVQNRDKRRHPKARVIGLELNGEARVWPFDELVKAHAPVLEELGGKIVQVHYELSAWQRQDYRQRG